ncbi:hypothetical protein HY635_01165 [Candidatus Uhrbacteria bacterium]|nr:hypothetical protein [Candidatus Uhrbacteria bacterium]
MRLHQLLRLAIAACAAFIVIAAVSQYLFGVPIYANFTTYGVLLLACAFVYRIARPVRNQVETIIRLGIAYALLFAFLQRLVSLLYFPNTFGFSKPPDFEPLWVYTLPEFHRAILTYLVVVAIFLIGMKFAVRWRDGMHTNPPAHRYASLLSTRRIIYVAAIAALALAQILGAVMGWRMGSAVSWRWGWIVRLLPTSLFLVAMIILFFRHHAALTRGERTLTIGFLALFVVMSLAQGSRSGIVTFANLLIFGALIVYGNFYIPRRWVAWMAFGVVLLGPLFWGVGSMIRSSGIASGTFSFGWNDVILISRRFGIGFDDFIVVASGRWDHAIASQYVTMRNIVGVAVNGSLPGDILSVPWEGFSLANVWIWIAWGERIWRQLPLHGEGWHTFSQFRMMWGLSIAMALTGCWAYVVARAFSWCQRRGTTFFLIVASSLLTEFTIEFFNGKNLDSMLNSILSLAAYFIVFALFIQFMDAIVRTAHSRNVHHAEAPALRVRGVGVPQ